MKEQLISIETAKLAKEKGFNISTKSYYGCDNPSGDTVKPNQLFTIELKEEGITESQKGTMVYSAPRQSLLQKWLREKHNIHIKVDDFLDNDNKTDWDYEVVFIGTDINEKGEYIAEIPYDCDRSYITYEEALEKGLQEALKLI